MRIATERSNHFRPTRSAESALQPGCPDPAKGVSRGRTATSRTHPLPMSTAELSLKQEKRLLKKLQAGDQAAFATFYNAFAQRLYRAVIFPRIGVEDVSEDVLRDTFLTAFEKIGTVEWQNRSLYWWLSRIAHNKVIDVHRSRQRNDKFVQGYTPYLELSSTPSPDPEDAYLSEEGAQMARTLVTRLLEQLNDRYRAAVELRYIKGLSRAECAETMDVTVGNFDVILFRAIKRLRTLHERETTQR